MNCCNRNEGYTVLQFILKEEEKKLKNEKNEEGAESKSHRGRMYLLRPNKFLRYFRFIKRFENHLLLLIFTLKFCIAVPSMHLFAPFPVQLATVVIKSAFVSFKAYQRRLGIVKNLFV